MSREEIDDLIARLRMQVYSGRRNIGGASISADGKCKTWGGEVIMRARNPDGNTAADLIEAQRQALEGMVNVYTELVNCGDCGYWDPEKDDAVIAARKALEGVSGGG